jgi:hypothetical protein
MRKAVSSVIAVLGGIVLAAPAIAEVSIVVDKAAQRMTVSVNGQQRYSWPVSTGTADYSTLAGIFTPSRLAICGYVDGPRLARMLDDVLIGSLAVICPASCCGRT